MSRVLIDSASVMLNIDLATKLGMYDAIMLQQISVLSLASKDVVNGFGWVCLSVREWHEMMQFMSESTIKAAINRLREKGLVVAEKLAKNKVDHRLFYRIDYGCLRLLQEGK